MLCHALLTEQCYTVLQAEFDELNEKLENSKMSDAETEVANERVEEVPIDVFCLCLLATLRQDSCQINQQPMLMG